MSTWQMTTRVSFYGESIFKTKPINQDLFLIHLPRKGEVHTVNNLLNDQKHTFTFRKQLQALEYFTIGSQGIVVVGTKDGRISCQMFQGSQQVEVGVPQGIGERQAYVNDLLHIREGKVVNCYNDGSLAIWDLYQQGKINPSMLMRKKIHNSFTYKIRKIDEERIITCSNDKTVALFDLEEREIEERFEHPSPIWCAYPLSPHVFCSGGLTNQLTFWDIRQKRIANFCLLEQEETSYITSLDKYNIIFGDGRELCTCDLRKTQKQKFGNRNMKISAESILVRENEVIATGRGGDLCRIARSCEGQQLEQREEGEPISRRLQLQELLMVLQGIPRFNAQNLHWQQQDSGDQVLDWQILEDDDDSQDLIQNQNYGEQAIEEQIQVQHWYNSEQQGQQQDEDDFLDSDND